MRVTTAAPVPGAPTVASSARRTQIVAATIQVIATDGFGQTSFARIAERAGLSSTRLISYHFANKDELIGAVVEEVLASIAAYVGSRIDAAEKSDGQGNATAILTAYLEGNVAFIDSHRAHMQALMQIVLSGATVGEAVKGPGADAPTQDPPTKAEPPIEGLLRHGQRTGQFRSFDVASVGNAIQRAIEGLPFMLAAEPHLDCDLYARELVALFLRGVREEGS